MEVRRTMVAPRLSICIATYNRADVIGQTLDSIISQIRQEVEIVVADGASTDDTAVVVQRYQDQCPSLRYYRLPVKGGVDRDYCHAVSSATGEYCWLLTDDDIIKPGAINKILELLPHKYSLVILNAEVWDRSLTHRMKDKQLRLAEDTFYQASSRETLFIETVQYLSFIGAVVIDRALWNARIKGPYIGTEFVHVGIIFQEDLPNGAFAVAEPYIMIRYGNAQWSSRYFAVWMIRWPDLLWSFSGISDSAKVRVSPRNPWDNVVTLLFHRAYGVYCLIEYNAYLKKRLSSRMRRMIATGIALLPGLIVNLLIITYIKVIALNDAFLWHNLKTSRFYYRKYLSRIGQSLKRAIALSGKKSNS